MTTPLDAVAALAEASAQQRGSSLVGRGLRLFEHTGPVVAAEVSDSSPFFLGRSYELLLSPGARRKSGAHLTPESIAHSLVGLLPAASVESTVLDPSVGGGAFLLAAADRLVHVGVEPSRVLTQLHGVDLDPGAVAVAEAALALWGIDHGVEPRPLEQLLVGDGLLMQLPVVDRVVGNPPFLSQLRSGSSNSAERRGQLRERWGDLVGAYTDDAWLFLAASVDALAPGGAVAMVQPVSILAARHARPSREYIADRVDLQSLWVARDRVFDAAVQVCGIVATAPATTGEHRAEVACLVGSDFEQCAPQPQPAPDGWAGAASSTFGVPQIRVRGSGTVGDLATATAGFRDQFYGFVPHVSEGPASQTPSLGHPCLVTVGMIEPLRLDWGKRSFKFAKKSYTRPMVDMAALRAEDRKLAAWVDARLRPKLLMATQTRVVEVWVDAEGAAVPATPVVSIEPISDDPEDLWRIAAALTAPSICAHFVGTKFGTAMSLGAMKLAASDVLSAPLPRDIDSWYQAAELLQQASQNSDPFGDVEEFSRLMGDAYRTTDVDLRNWWMGRLRLA